MDESLQPVWEVINIRVAKDKIRDTGTLSGTQALCLG